MKLKIKLDVERRLGDPLVKIIVDDYLTLSDGIAQNEYNFDCDIEDGIHELKIVHYGKTKHDHAYDDLGKKVSVDKHVEITAIEIDDIALEAELWSGKFYPVYLNRKDIDPLFISPNLYLGHNGTWMLEFATPAGNWLIDLRKPGPKLDGTIFRTNDNLVAIAKDFFKDLPDV